MAQHRWAMGASLATACLMLVGKIVAATLTGSVALFSDACESVIHIVATGVAAFALWWSRQPADEDHPYGHGKVAYFSAGFEGALILVAALSILFVSVRARWFGSELQSLGAGLAITAVLATINGVLAWYLMHVGRTTRSLVLLANGQHVLSDCLTSVGVLVGIAVVWLTGLTWLDPLIAVIVGVQIVWSACQLLRLSFRGLMDHSLPEEARRIEGCLSEAVEDASLISYHAVKHRRVGHEVFVEAHLLFPDDWTLKEAHARAAEIEGRINALFPDEYVHITTHLEPASHEEVHPGPVAASSRLVEPSR